ncbi:MAG: sugar ABC transporter permease, partial [Paracoccaceae bacterium]
MSSKEYLHIVTQDHIPVQKMRFGRALIWGSAGIFFCLVFLQLLQQNGVADFKFSNWRPTLYAYGFWAVCLCAAQVLMYGERGKRTLFVLP